MIDLLSYLVAQARRAPVTAARFAAGEVLRRGRLRWSNSLERNLPDVSPQGLSERLRPLLPEHCLVAEAFRTAYPDATGRILAAAEQICRNEITVFGERVCFNGDGDWHIDWKTGYRWPSTPGARIAGGPLGTDVKRPWELARFHQGLTLGAAFQQSGDARYAASFAAQVRSWIRQNPYPCGIHWAMPMEAAVRAVNWASAAALLVESRLPESFWKEFLHSLYLQARFIHLQREWNSVARGNHYLSCVAGLIFMGVVFRDTPEGRGWLAFGKGALAREMEAQVGEDGAAHEGSSGYHAYVTELMAKSALAVTRLEALERGSAIESDKGREVLVTSWGEAFVARLEKMFEFCAALTRGREEPPILGDSDDGRLLPMCSSEAPAPACIAELGAALFARNDWRTAHACEEPWWTLGAAPREAAPQTPGQSSAAFPSAGFYFLGSQRIRASVRCGPLGVNGWANHAHCDQLSVEFSCDGQAILVDPGTFCYSSDPAARNEFRSTRYHNTVVVDGAEQNRCWPGLLFRMMDDTQSCVLRWEQAGGVTQFEGQHFGYRRLGQNATVARRVTLDCAAGQLLVHDTVEGAGEAQLAWHFHLAPGLAVEALSRHSLLTQALAGMDVDSAWCIGSVKLVVCRGSRSSPLQSVVEEGWVSRRYGHRTRAPILRFTCPSRLPAQAAFLFVC